jgi:tetratricopeptide (TPR) repeat protein
LESGRSVEETITDSIGVTGEKMELGYYEFVENAAAISYIHPGNKLATVVAFNKPLERQVVRDVAMQVAAMNPVAVTPADVPQKVIDTEKEIAYDKARQAGKPENLLDRIAEGALQKFYKESTLLQQEFVKDATMNIDQYLKKQDRELTVTAFKRITLNVDKGYSINPNRNPVNHMKKLSVLFCVIVYLVLVSWRQKPDDNKTVAEITRIESAVTQSFKDRDYIRAEKLLFEQKGFCDGLSAGVRKKYTEASINYNLACLYSLKKERKKALDYFEKAMDGYTNYSHVKTDKDLDYIRNEARFIKALENIRELGDYSYILQKAGDYREEDQSALPAIEYENTENWRIKEVKNYFNLDSVAGKGDELSQIINIMTWVHNSVRHDGNNWPACEIDAIDIYNYAKATKRGVNCRALAIMLNECYLAMGFKSRFITCMPKSESDPDCHVINCVYSATLGKWLWMDPSFNACVKDENGNLLSISEVRSRLIGNLPLVLNSDVNWNGEPRQKEWYLDYMAKNLYWFNCPVRSFFNVETRYRNTSEVYVALVPPDYTVQNAGRFVVTHDPDYFWKTPQVKREVTTSTLLTVEQMRKDIDYFFATVSKVHVNMYAFVSREKMDAIRAQLYQDCSKPMKAADFNLRIMKLNGLFDGHTLIAFNFWQILDENKDFFPLPVNFTDGEMYLMKDDGKSGKRIISINGTKSGDIYNRLINTNEIKKASEVRVSPRFATDLFIYTDIRSPYEVLVEGDNGKETVTLEGVAMGDVKKLPSGFDKQLSLGFRMYPEKSIAIIDYNTCSFGRDEQAQWGLYHWFDVRFKQLADMKIKTLFIDISRNGGGQSGNNEAIFKHIKQDKPVKLTYLIQRRYDPYADDESKRELGYLRNDTFQYSVPLNPKGYDGNIYLIQGAGSYSAAIGVAEWFKERGGAKLIGEQTGQATAVYIDQFGFSLPESRIYFGCAFKYWKALPGGVEDKGVQPDYPVALDYTKPYYDLNDLLGFMSQIDPAFRYEPVTPPKGVKVPVESASANCYQDGENIARALDGDLATLYNSPWTEKIDYPVILTFNFEGQSQIDFLKYYPRTEDPPNGLFGEVEIWASTRSDTTLRKIGRHDFYQSSAASYYRFPKPLKQPVRIELRVMSSMSWFDVIHVSCAEMEFYRGI